MSTINSLICILRQSPHYSPETTYRAAAYHLEEQDRRIARLEQAVKDLLVILDTPAHPHWAECNIASARGLITE